jgi:hypothetical protein
MIPDCASRIGSLVRRSLFGSVLTILFAAGALTAQDVTPTPPPAQPTPTPTSAPETTVPEEPAPARAPEGPRIINLPSAEVPASGTLGMLFTHRFGQPLKDSDWHSLFSFDSGADIGIGIFYVPLSNLEVSVDRSSNQDVWEVAAQYQFLGHSDRFPLALALRAGTDIRTEVGVNRENSYFAQGIAALTLWRRVRMSVVPTYVSQTAGTPFLTQPQDDVFNVLGALAVAVTRTVNVQGEIIPRRGRFGSDRTGWIAAIEKTVLRHRFSFTVGNVRTTTVDQYTAPEYIGLARDDCFIGFNLARQWKLK